MANYENEINSWPVLKNGLHYKWLVDYAAFSAFGTFELTAEEWEKRDLIVNFKGNSELTTEMDHQEALKKAIKMVSDELKTLLGEEAAQFTLVCIPAALGGAYQAPFQGVQRGDMQGYGHDQRLPCLQLHA